MVRIFLLLMACCWLSISVWAQEGVTPPAVGEIPAVGELGTPGVGETVPSVTAPTPPIDTQPAGAIPQPPPPDIPSAPATTPRTPPAAGSINIQAGRVFILEAERVVRYYGNVVLIAQGIEIHADELSYDLNTDIGLARGNVTVSSNGALTSRGSTLEYRARTQEWRFLDWSAQFPPAFLGAPFVAPVYVSGQEASGLPNSLLATNSVVTTCGLPVPHYYIQARRVEIYPQDKLIARDCDVYVLGRRVLHIPWFYLSLQQNRTPFVPEVGQNDYEGYYLRVLYQYVLNPRNVGGIRLDLTSRLGVGVGVDHFYTVPGGQGEAFLYARQGLREYVVRDQHTQLLPARFALAVNTDIRKNSRFTVQPTTITDVKATLTRPRLLSLSSTGADFYLNYSRTLNQGQYFSDRTSANLAYDYRFTRGMVRYSAEYTSFGQTLTSGAAVTPTQQLWQRINALYPLGFAAAALRVDQRVNVGESTGAANQFFGVQRLPEFTLQANQSNSSLPFFRTVPGAMTLGWGFYDEQPNDVRLNRYLLNWNVTPRELRLGNTTIRPNAEFRQTVYGDPDVTAQYNYTAGLSTITRFGALTNSLRYSKQSARGFSPFRFDAVYPYETANNSLEYRTPSVNVTLAGGRDLERSSWYDLTFRGDAKLGSRVWTTNTLAYDVNTGTWRDWVNQLTFRNDPKVKLNVGTRYDMEAGRLRRVSAELQWVISPMWRVQWLGGYDGLTRSTQYNEFLVTRDLHCWDASLFYSEQQKYFYAYFRLKALNLPYPRFGIGRGGQVLSTSQGSPF